MTTALIVLLAGWLAAALGWRVASLRALARHLERAGSPPAGTRMEGVSMLRPLHGAPDGLESCLESAWRAASAADARVVVGVAAGDDPALDAVAVVRERWPGVQTEVRVGVGPPGRNRKVANLVQMDAGATSALLVIADADVRVPEDYLARLGAAFEDAGVGLATCPYRSVPFRTLASRVDALITNTHFLPSTCLAVEVEGLHFGLGATIAVRREVLERSGGFAALLDEPADDHVIARNVERAGYRLAWAPALVDHLLEDEGWSGSARRHLRWAGVVRGVRGGGYAGLVLTHGVVPAAALGALAGPGGPLSGVAAAVLWWCVECAALWRLRAALGLRSADLLLLPLAEVLGLMTWLGGFLVPARPPST